MGVGYLGCHGASGTGRARRHSREHAGDCAPARRRCAGEWRTATPYLLDAEKTAYEQLAAFYEHGSGYSVMMTTRPQTLGYGLSVPAGLAAWFHDKFAAWTDSGGDPERVLSRDDMLDDITLYWLTNTVTTSARLYWRTTPTISLPSMSPSRPP